MGDDEQVDIDLINRLMAEELAKPRLEPIPVHEAGHAIVALHLGLHFVGINIKECDVSDGSKFGGTKVRSISDSFSEKEIQEHSPDVIECVRRHIIMLLAGAAATQVILGNPYIDLAQRDRSVILGLLGEFPELKGKEEDLAKAAMEAVVTCRVNIEKLALAVRERIELNAAEVTKVIEN